MQNARIKVIHEALIQPHGSVVYWLQHTQRIDQNYALHQAIQLANDSNIPLKVIFVLNPNYPEANLRHFSFMLEGIEALFQDLGDLGIQTDLLMGEFLDVIPSALEDASAFVMDKAYTRYLRHTKSKVAKLTKQKNIHTVMVESDLVVPIEIASEKLEYAARTIRPKLHKVKDDYLNLFDLPELNHKSPQSTSPFGKSLDAFLRDLPIDKSVSKAPSFKGGEKAAMERLKAFITNGLSHYHEANDPSKAWNSYLSPYLHFGMISPVRIIHEIEMAANHKKIPQDALDGYIEQVLIRRELAFNFIYYEPGYDEFDHMTYEWAYKTMQDHADDLREYTYTISDYESLNTHDIYFNKAMQDMIEKGTMPNYMRMYWGKKIIEWSSTYKEAYTTTLYLNNKYFLDGRDANSYTGVAWLFGRHDRAWTERAIFGKLRYMNQAGLTRKFDMDAYLKR